MFKLRFRRLVFHNKWIDWYYENPLKTYNKIKKYFRPIKAKFNWSFGKGNKPYIIELNSFDVTWKDKWRSPRHEYNPRIILSLFNYIHLYVDFTVGDSMDDMVYWEAALWWIYYNKDLEQSVKRSNGWSQYNEETKEYERFNYSILKDKYQKMFDSGNLPKIIYNENKH